MGFHPHKYFFFNFLKCFLIERKSVVRGVEYWLPVDIYGVYGNPKMPIFNSLDDAVNVINSIKDGIKYHYFEV